jgi:hypothetical protein
VGIGDGSSFGVGAKENFDTFLRSLGDLLPVGGGVSSTGERWKRANSDCENTRRRGGLLESKSWLEGVFGASKSMDFDMS